MLPDSHPDWPREHQQGNRARTGVELSSNDQNCQRWMRAVRAAARLRSTVRGFCGFGVRSWSSPQYGSCGHPHWSAGGQGEGFV